MHQFKQTVAPDISKQAKTEKKTETKRREKIENIPEPRVIICQNVVHTLNAQNKSSQLTSPTVLSEMEAKHERERERAKSDLGRAYYLYLAETLVALSVSVVVAVASTVKSFRLKCSNAHTHDCAAWAECMAYTHHRHMCTNVAAASGTCAAICLTAFASHYKCHRCCWLLLFYFF